MFREAMGLREAEEIAIKTLNRHGFLWPAELARLTGLSWHRADRLLRRLRRDWDLEVSRVGPVKLYHLRWKNEKHG
jgi:hypothetical protein